MALHLPHSGLGPPHCAVFTATLHTDHKYYAVQIVQSTQPLFHHLNPTISNPPALLNREYNSFMFVFPLTHHWQDTVRKPRGHTYRQHAWSSLYKNSRNGVVLFA